MNYSFFRALSFALKDFWRNIWLSLVTITVLILAILSVNILVSLNAISTRMTDVIKEKVDISVFFQDDALAAQVTNFQERLKAMPEAKELVFVSREQALEIFKEKHKDDPRIMEALKELDKNPLADSLIIKARSIDDYSKILTFINLDENQKIIKSQNYTDHQKIIDRVNVISDKTEKVGIGITLAFALIAILIIFNSIRVMVYTHREEISVMRLVGASNWFIRLPFLLESVLYSVFSLVLAIGILYVILGASQPYLASFLESYNFNLVSYFNQNFIIIFVSELVATIVLSIISSGIAITRYLKV